MHVLRHALPLEGPVCLFPFLEGAPADDISERQIKKDMSTAISSKYGLEHEQQTEHTQPHSSSGLSSAVLEETNDPLNKRNSNNKSSCEHGLPWQNISSALNHNSQYLVCCVQFQCTPFLHVYITVSKRTQGNSVILPLIWMNLACCKYLYFRSIWRAGHCKLVCAVECQDRPHTNNHLQSKAHDVTWVDEPQTEA